MTHRSVTLPALLVTVAVVLVTEGAWVLAGFVQNPLRGALMIVSAPALPGLAPSIVLVGLSHAWKGQSEIAISLMQLKVATPINLLVYFGFTFQWFRLSERKRNQSEKVVR